MADGSHEVALEAGENVVDIAFGYEPSDTINGELPPATPVTPEEPTTAETLVRTGATV